MLRNTPEERKSHEYRSGSLKSWLLLHVSVFVGSHHQAYKKHIKKDYLYITQYNGTTSYS
jgi:hypothetical protein